MGGLGQRQLCLLLTDALYRHIVETDLPVDIQVLLHYLELISIEIIWTYRKSSKRGLDSLTLPRSWILRLVQVPHRDFCYCPQVQLILNSASSILQTLLAGDTSGEPVSEQHRFSQFSHLYREHDARWPFHCPTLTKATLYSTTVSRSLLDRITTRTKSGGLPLTTMS